MKHLTSYVKYNESVEDLSIELITDLISNDVEDNFDYSTIKECYYKEKKMEAQTKLMDLELLNPEF